MGINIKAAALTFAVAAPVVGNVMKGLHSSPILKALFKPDHKSLEGAAPPLSEQLRRAIRDTWLTVESVFCATGMVVKETANASDRMKESAGRVVEAQTAASRMRDTLEDVYRQATPQPQTA